MNIAIIHDWLTGMRGGENCLEVFCELFPQATLFTLLHKKGSVSKTIEEMEIKTSFLQHIPFALQHYRQYLPLFPAAIESFDLKGYDLVFSSSHCVAKGVKPDKDALHISYCYTPMRYAWLFFEDYFGKENFIKRRLISMVINSLKAWDLKSNQNVDFFIAISDNVKDRIQRFYHRDSTVICPPVETKRFSLAEGPGSYYLMASALVPYKRVDLAVEAFNQLGKKLVVVGSGDCHKSLKAIAKDNIEFVGWKSGQELVDYYRGCRALIFPGDEDFGIVPLEAHACGRPVIAFGKGGALETVNAQTGVFFYKQTPQALADAVVEFEKREATFDRAVIRNNSLKFDRDLFKQKIISFIESKLNV